MKQIGTVIAVDTAGNGGVGTATVQVQRRTACDGCHNPCSGGECTNTLVSQPPICLTVENAVAATVGDRVVLSTNSRQVLAISAGVYLVPLVLSAISFWLNSYFCSEGVNIGITLVIFVAGFAGAAAVCNRISQKHIRYHMELE